MQGGKMYGSATNYYRIQSTRTMDAARIARVQLDACAHESGPVAAVSVTAVLVKRWLRTELAREEERAREGTNSVKAR